MYQVEPIKDGRMIVVFLGVMVVIVLVVEQRCYSLCNYIRARAGVVLMTRYSEQIKGNEQERQEFNCQR